LSTGQITFEKTYGGSFRDEGLSVDFTSDSGYVIAGCTESFGAGMRDVYLLRIDSLGDTVWSRSYGGPDFDCGYSVQQTQDGGFVIAGYTESFGAGLLDIYLVKTDAVGDTEWTRTFGGPGYDCGYSVRQTLDGGYIVAGYTESFGAGLLDIYLVKTDAAGDTQWARTYGESSYDCAYSVCETEDGGYIVAGYTESFGEGGQDIYLVRTDAFGDTIWTKAHGGLRYDCGYSVRETPDSGYVVAGYTESSGEGLQDACLVRTDASGNTLWSKTYGGTDYDCANSVQPTLDGGLVAAGYTESFGAGLSDVYVVKTDSFGGVLWARQYGGRRYDSGWCVQETPDSGLVLAGVTNSFGAGEDDAYVIKLTVDGLVARDVRVASLDAPPDTVFSDSIYSVIAAVENLMLGYPSFDVVVTIDGYTDTAQVAALPTDSLHQVVCANWQVPSADSVTYTATVCVSTPGDIDTSNDCVTRSVFAYSPVGLAESPTARTPAQTFTLKQVGSNPCRSPVEIQYSLSNEAWVTLQVLDTSGRYVRTLADEESAGGLYSVLWDGEGDSGDRMPSGIYFAVLQARKKLYSQKIVLLD
jgi:hypothetical protein